MNKENIEKYRHLIDLCRLIKDKDDYLARETGYNFNIFSILDREREEVRTHSYFLYELLNPYGSHNQGSKFVEIFLSEILDLEDMGNSKNIKVYRESLTTKNKRIDFIIECDTMIIGIEMKIDAMDGASQLYDYYEELQCRTNSSSKDFKLFYLTLDGKDASVDSMQSLNQEDVINISFETTILKWLQECMESVVNISILREALYQYYILIEKIVGKKGTMMDEVSDFLIKDNNLEYVMELSKSVPYAQAKIQKMFWEKLISKLNEIDKKCEFVNYNFSKQKTRDDLVNSYYGLGKERLTDKERYFGIKYNLIEKEKYIIALYIELRDKLYYGVTIAKKDKNGLYKRDTFCLDEEFNHYRIEINNTKIFRTSSNWWLGWNYFNNCAEVDFYKFNISASKLVDKSIMDNYIDCLVSEIIKVLSDIKKVIK